MNSSTSDHVRFHKVDDKYGAKPIIVDGREYGSINDASKALGISPGNLATHMRKLNKSGFSELDVTVTIKKKITLKKCK